MRALVCLLCVLGMVISYCPNGCNKHGVCELDSTCTCFDQWSGADCAERACPTGPEWGGDHVKFSVCSGRGECDRRTGNCQCNEGFSGKACQVMQCPRGDSPTSSCNGHGTCVSEGNLIHHYVYSDGSPLEDTYGWGKNRIYGCMCVGQYSGYDCTEQICPMGAVEYKDHWDSVSFFKVPKESDQSKLLSTPSVEISIINCDLADNRLEPKNKEICRQYTVKAHISYTAAQLRTMIKSTGIVYDLVIRYLSSENDAKSVMPKDTELKDATIVEFNFVIEPTAKVNKIWYGANKDYVKRVTSLVTEIESKPIDPSFNRIQPTFNDCMKNVTDDNGYSGDKATDALLCRMGKYHKKLYQICSGNGECNLQTGECQCLITREGDDRYVTDNFRFPSDQVDPTVYNCQVKVASESHVNTCNGHGELKRPEPSNSLNETNMHQYCNCYDGYTGPTCNLHDCSDRRGRSWFNPAGHIAGSICSNMGKCNMKEGVCECSAGYFGNDCSQLACPSTVAGVDCSGHGICQPKLTNITYEQEWDFLSTSECICHDGYYGASCTELSCPSGPDPMKKSDSGLPPHISIQYNQNITFMKFTIEYAGLSVEIQVQDTIFAVYNKLMTINGLKPTVSIHDCGSTAKESETKEMCQLIDVSKENKDLTVNNGDLYRIYFHYYCGDELDYTPQIENLAGKGLKINPSGICANDPVNGYVTKGTIPCYECSNHGYCDHNTGLCKCVLPWASSKNYDEKNEIDAGTRGDCSFFRKYVGGLPEYQVQPTTQAERYAAPQFEAPKVVDPMKYSQQQQVKVPYPQKPLADKPNSKY